MAADPGSSPAGRHDVEVVVVPRERYTSTVPSLRKLLATLPGDVGVTLVRGGMGRRIVREAAALEGGRVRVVGPARHLAPNTARAIGLEEASARYVVFIDNDVAPSPGWLEALTRVASEHGAWVVRPLVLQSIGGEVTVHESGGDCHLERRGDLVTLVDTHRHLGLRLEEVGPLATEEVELFEFHTALFDRERLLALGGFDPALRSVAEHLDLALRIHSHGGSVWLEPESRVTYVVPDRLPLRDLPFFLGRWSRSWNIASRQAFCAKHGVTDEGDPYGTWRYPEKHRSYAWLSIGRAAAVVSRQPVARGMAFRFDKRVGWHLAEAVQRLAPRWRLERLRATS